jgi:hypothetical protein
MGGNAMVMPQQQQGVVVGGNAGVSVMSPMSAQMGGMQQGYNGGQMVGMQQGYVQQGGLDASQQMQQQQGGGYQQVQGGGDNYQQMWNSQQQQQQQPQMNQMGGNMGMQQQGGVGQSGYAHMQTPSYSAQQRYTPY